MTLEMLDETDPNGEVLGWLTRMTEIYNSFAATPRQATAVAA
jgi:hypothetical protein